MKAILELSEKKLQKMINEGRAEIVERYRTSGIIRVISITGKKQERYFSITN